jgi:hypothetical protein
LERRVVARFGQQLEAHGRLSLPLGPGRESGDGMKFEILAAVSLPMLVFPRLDTDVLGLTTHKNNIDSTMRL